MALFRALLALLYLAAEAGLNPAGPGGAGWAVIALFVLYSGGLLAAHASPLVRQSRLWVLFLDLTFLLSLIFFGITWQGVTLAALFYGFLVLESWAQQEAREVILIATALALVAYAARTHGGRAAFAVTVESVLFLLVVAGLLAFLVSDERYLAERRIAAIANRSGGASIPATVTAMRDALEELCRWFRCSHALLAFWDERYDHFCLCRYPPPGGAPELEESREWSVFRGERLDVAVNYVTAETGMGAAPYDLHPHLIQKFEIHNALGCGLSFESQIVGRLLLINRPSPFRPPMLKRLQQVAPAFARLVRHVMIILEVEQAAYERERSRVAQDFHDGPLQSVISFQMRVHTIAKLLERDPAKAAAELDQLQEIARRQVADMRTFVNAMRPVETNTSSLAAAARRLVDDFQKESNVPVTFVSGPEPIRLPGKIGVDILQIIREALHNIYKHAQATHVQFSLEQNDKQLVIAVNDNGRGFRFGGKYSLEELEQLRLGPNSIKQRMRALGGEMSLDSQPGTGTSLRMKIPLY